jgi:hypothetical protein
VGPRTGYVLVSGQPPEHGLPQHPDKRVPAVLARAGVCEPRTRHRAEAERVVQFAVGEQTGVRRDDRAAKLERQPGSKSSLTAAPFDSPAGFVMKAAFKSA